MRSEKIKKKGSSRTIIVQIISKEGFRIAAYSLPGMSFKRKEIKEFLVCMFFLIWSSNVYGKKDTARYNSFYIDQIGAGHDAYSILIFDFLINGVSYTPSAFPIYDDIITDYRGVKVMEEDEVSILLGFSSYRSHEKLSIEYKIDNSSWHPVSSRTSKIVLYHLSAGQYDIYIRAMKNNGQIVSFSTIKLEVMASWWERWWGGITFLLIGLSVFVYYQYRIRQEKLLERLQIEQLTNLNLRTAFKLKLGVVAEVAHEFSTPLMLILNIFDKLRNKGNEEDIKQLDKVGVNIERLKKLVHELSDINADDKKDEMLMVASYDIVPFLRNTVLLFEELAEKEQIDLEFKTTIESVVIWFNKDQLEKVLFNLLSNAFKFTPVNGKITVSIDSSGESSSTQTLQITIEDSGVGIEENALGKIFTVNYSSMPLNSFGIESSGIGLYLCKKLIELHHGKITVNSKKGEGTRFTIILYKGTAHFQKAQLLRFKPQQTSMRAPLRAADKIPDTVKTEKVMIVEDNREMREYVKELLSDRYKNVLQAHSGVDGIESIRINLPDIIITDLSMNGKDGKGLIIEIRKDELTSHIPIIVLSAFTSDEIKADILAVGADTYLTKPCDKRLLLASIESLLHSRANLRKIFSHSVTDIEGVLQKSKDTSLLKRAIAIIDKHMSEPDFDVAALAAKLNVSRSLLYLKFPAITSHSPKDFIHIMRVRKGAKLIKSGRYNINEASDEIGYNNVKNFRKYFKYYFGASPSLFIRNHRLRSE